ncbi:MAG: UDP-N-acetylmuramoyl-L-alanyl-D-glutamate--2,6-diaminopimelate ligase [Clostridia bacterium]|nr:UDP-N-acetylmuramoyl-L-alanyl-D-glutamate--2,6-diaminopimelate ligase [Clostridia bacterium]
MKLYKLLKDINCRTIGNLSIDITGLYHKDTEVKEGGLFFCLRGTRVDGMSFVLSAIKNGAVAIVVEQELPGLFGITQIITKNSREAMSLISSKFFGSPADKLKIIGVTGTNGKTTTVSFLSQIFETAGKKTAIIGTNGVFFGGARYETGMTTPDPIELHKFFDLMVKAHVEFVFMEVSAHAIDLKKICGINFEIVVFTNLTEDHLDYFPSIEKYFETKRSLFSKAHAKFAILNADDEFGKRIISSINMPFLTYAITEKATVKCDELVSELNFQKFKINNEEFTLNIAGRFNVFNCLAAISVAKVLGISYETIKKALLSLKSVDGRFNTKVVLGVLVIIDYAHTPDGLSNILSAARELSNGKVISVFGCGGNREVQKRKIMGEISSKLANFTIITSDNPRFESRLKIAKDIESGILNSNYIIELDRSKAIKKAISIAEKGDVVVIAGKGAETYIDENGIKIPYSDYDEIKKIEGEK